MYVKDLLKSNINKSSASSLKTYAIAGVVKSAGHAGLSTPLGLEPT